MDEMKIKLSTRFMRGMVAKLISRAIYKNIGVKPDIRISEIEAEMKDGKIRFHINADGEIDQKVLLKIEQIVDSEEQTPEAWCLFFYSRNLQCLLWKDNKLLLGGI